MTAAPPSLAPTPWIGRAPAAPYFVDEAGADWHPIGYNDAATWPELRGLLTRRAPDDVRRHLHALRDSGVTCLRVMLEYCQGDTAFLERPAGAFNPRMVRFWDELVALCGQAGLRLLLTPFDTFFTWIRWRQHPYNARNGGPCAAREQLLTCPATRAAIKRRLAFATARWGGSGTVFAWDLWNEMHPAHGGRDPASFGSFIDDVGGFLRAEEQRLHGRAHLQTVSVFGPELPHDAALRQAIFRHPGLDFATSHLYAEGTIDHPQDTVAPARAAAALVRQALDEIGDARPFLDSEHGPIHTFKDHRRTLPAAFDDEYFRHMQWAHLAAGGAGGGMRWPNRNPHVLTPGMRAAQRAMAGFLPLLAWQRFARRPLGARLRLDDPAVDGFGCGDAAQAVVWLLRARPLAPDGRVQPGCAAPATVQLSGMRPGAYRVTAWDTQAGRAEGEWLVAAQDGVVGVVLPRLGADLALAVRPKSVGPGSVGLAG